MADKNARTGLSLDDMTTLIKAVSESGLESFDYKEGDFSITLHSNRTTGIYQAAPAQDAEPFVKIGDRVKKGQVLAIVEAMKMMNEIESDCDGTISEIMVTNGSPVEYGQPLFRIS